MKRGINPRIIERRGIEKDSAQIGTERTAKEMVRKQ